MKLTIFAKKRQTREGKNFYSYLTTLKRKKDGEDQVVSVKFSDDCGTPDPKKCPVIIGVEKENANISKKKYEREDTGEIGYSYTLWINEYIYLDEKYVDHSLDEFDV